MVATRLPARLSSRHASPECSHRRRARPPLPTAIVVGTIIIVAAGLTADPAVASADSGDAVAAPASGECNDLAVLDAIAAAADASQGDDAVRPSALPIGSDPDPDTNADATASPADAQAPAAAGSPAPNLRRQRALDALPYRLRAPETVSILGLPWFGPEAYENKPSRSWLWNTRYRPGRGWVGLTGRFHAFEAGGFEFPQLVTGTENDVNGADFQEVFARIYFAGVIVHGLAIELEAGGFHGRVAYPDRLVSDGLGGETTQLGTTVNYGVGVFFGVALRGAIPLGPIFTLLADVSFRHWSADADELALDDTIVTNELSGDALNYELKLSIEVIQNPTGVTLDLYFGAGGHMHRGSIGGAAWTVPGRDLQDFDGLWGASVIFGEVGTIRLDVRFPFNLDARISFELILF